MVNLPDLAAAMNAAGILNKTFMEMTRPEIETMISAVFSSPDDEVPADGWAKPIIHNGKLLIPFDSHPKYHWWKPGCQGVLETLVELDAPWEVARTYLETRGVGAMTEAAYMNRLIPF